jgi:hypothetical protein
MVWLLAAILALPATIKITHIANSCLAKECDACPDDARPQHDCSACPVCHFMLASFIEAVAGSENRLPALETVEAVPAVRNRICLPVLLPCGLRAPPFV